MFTPIPITENAFNEKGDEVQEISPKKSQINFDLIGFEFSKVYSEISTLIEQVENIVSTPNTWLKSTSFGITKLQAS